jgi:hypothetical protein
MELWTIGKCRVGTLQAIDDLWNGMDVVIIDYE